MSESAAEAVEQVVDETQPDTQVDTQPDTQPNEEDQIDPLLPTHLHVLVVIKDTQRQQGLRHSDYLRYRQYCSRRLQRLRNVLKFHCGKGKVFQKQTVDATLVAKDIRYLHIILFEIERAWSFYMQLKQSSSLEHRHIFHARNRLRKAVAHAKTLDQLAESCTLDPRTKLEITAYTNWINASLHFELEHWEEAAVSFVNSRLIYEKLSSACAELQKPIYVQRVDEITANVRFCAHNLGSADPSELLKMRSQATDANMASLAERLDEAVLESRKAETESASEVNWQGRTVAVKNEKFRISLVKARTKEFEIDQSAKSAAYDALMTLYDELFIEYNDALSILNVDIQAEERLQAKSASQKSELVLAQLKFLRSYVSYLKLTRTMERNMLMIAHMQQTSSKPGDVIRLYDILLQNVLDLEELETLKGNMAFAKKTAAQTLYFKAFRCVALADSHRSDERLAEASALYDRALTYCRQAKSHYEQCEEDVSTPQSELQGLLKTIRGRQLAVQAQAVLQSQDPAATGVAGPTAGKTLFEDSGAYSTDPNLLANPNLVAFPPNFEPIPCKPLFFDLANHHLSFPSLESRKTRKTATEKVTGFIRGFFGGGAKK
eukprot:m.559045 g.559045  ORF g.559045 m.559045 type:complete len:606 (+) comp57765_c0_seq2:1091-2908(+)